MNWTYNKRIANKIENFKGKNSSLLIEDISQLIPKIKGTVN